jgi:hypothetical protein
MAAKPSQYIERQKQLGRTSPGYGRDDTSRTELEHDKSESGTDRLGTPGALDVGNHARSDDIAPTTDPVQAAGDPATEPVHLPAAFEANPELRAAWHDAKSHREAFATPEAARGHVRR